MKANEIKKLTYDDAKKKLLSILNELETKEISIDTLEDKVKNAKALIAHCEKKLLKSKTSIEEMLED